MRKKDKNEKFGFYYFYSPGRTELAGNHTDHNGGKALVMAMPHLKTDAVVKVRDDNLVIFDSVNFPKYTVDLSNLDMVEDEKGTTSSLIRGVAYYIKEKGGQIGGFEAEVGSSVPVGSGLSSSASVEILLARIFNKLYNNDSFNELDLAVIAQKAENNFFGKPCGLMDQLACSYEKIIKIDFKKEKTPDIKIIKKNISRFGYDILIIDTKCSHANLTDDYKTIPEEMKAVARYFGKDVLGEVNSSDFYSSLHSLRKEINNDRAILRALHFFSENDRVDMMTNALLVENFSYYLELVNECGKSSALYLQNMYTPSNTKIQGLSLALALTEKFLEKDGACRIHGGGFGGTIQAYIPHEKTQEYLKTVGGALGDYYCYKI